MNKKTYEGRTWEELKNLISVRNLKLQYKEKNHWWELYCTEKNIIYKCILPKASSVLSKMIIARSGNTEDNEQDFLNNYKDVSNKPVVFSEEEGMAILDRYFEHDSVPKLGGVESRIYDVPDGVTWAIQEFGGSSNNNSCEVQLLASLDGGNTWGHPWDENAEKIRAIHLDKGVVGSVRFANPLKFTGDNGNVKLKISLKNYNTTITAEVDGWINGFKE